MHVCVCVFVYMHVHVCECFTLVCEAHPTVCCVCSLQDCARDTYRNEQCAATNSIPLGGHFYTWTEYDPELGRTSVDVML